MRGIQISAWCMRYWVIRAGAGTTVSANSSNSALHRYRSVSHQLLIVFLVEFFFCVSAKHAGGINSKYANGLLLIAIYILEKLKLVISREIEMRHYPVFLTLAR